MTDVTAREDDDGAGPLPEAAVIMGPMRSALRAYVLESADPATALRLLDRKIQPVMAAPGAPAGLLPLRPDPPIGTADDPRRRSTTALIPPGALLCCFTDGLVERRGEVIDRGIETLAAALDTQIAGPNPGTPVRH